MIPSFESMRSIIRGKLIKTYPLLTITTVAILLPPALLAQQPTYLNVPNPHNGSSPQNTNCTECHSKAAISAQIHPMDHLDTQSESIHIPESMPLLPDGSMNCLTCHLVVETIDRSNRSFLRGGPFRRELDFCYQCHRTEDYERVNPHRELLQADGTTNQAICLYCHAHQPSPENPVSVSRAMNMEMRVTCNKCHALHTHESDHYGRSLKKTKRAIRRQYRSTEKRFGIELPVSADQRIQCNTCHYVHGALGIDGAVFESSWENEHYLRLPREQLCYACHRL